MFCISIKIQKINQNTNRFSLFGTDKTKNIHKSRRCFQTFRTMSFTFMHIICTLLIQNNGVRIKYIV